MHGIPAEVKDEQLEEKVSDIFSELNISISKSDIVDYHQLGEFNTIIWFINQKFCKDALKSSVKMPYRKGLRLVISALTSQGLALMLTINYYVRTYSIQPASCLDVQKVNKSKENP